MTFIVPDSAGSITQDHCSSMTRVATLMSVYAGDDPALFDRALLSVIGQKLRGSIISRVYLAVDGRVPAEIEQVLEKRRGQIYKVVRVGRNQGLANALNHLIDALEDEDLAFRMDSDDVSMPGRYQLQIDHLTAHPQVDILGADIIEVDVVRGTRRQVRFYQSTSSLRDHLCRRVPVAHMTACLRRRVFQKVGGYPTSTGTSEDIAFWFKCAHAGFKFDNLHVPLVEVTVNENFWARRSLKKSVGELRCYLSGIHDLYGVTWRYVFPLARFALRLAPTPIVQLAYKLRSRTAPTQQ